MSSRAPDERLVDNAPLRAAFLESKIPAHEIAERAGVLRKVSRRRPGLKPRYSGDGTTLERELGLRRTSEGKLRRKMPEARALKYAEALGLYPVDVGL